MALVDTFKGEPNPLIESLIAVSINWCISSCMWVMKLVERRIEVAWRLNTDPVACPTCQSLRSGI
jgi:hypothetical protein